MLAQPDERICLEARRHGVVLLRPFAKAAALATAAGAVALVGWPATLAAAPVLAAAAVVAVRAAWRWERTQLLVTTEKVVVVDGTLRRRAAAVRLDRIGAVELEQSLAGRLLGYGTVVAADLEIPYVPEPRRVASLLDRLARR